MSLAVMTWTDHPDIYEQASQEPGQLDSLSTCWRHCSCRLTASTQFTSRAENTLRRTSDSQIWRAGFLAYPVPGTATLSATGKSWKSRYGCLVPLG